MVTQQIDALKQQYTDKYVVVDAEQPELARFRDVVGRVKTVNMSGRALVEFGDYFDNIGWYDIDLNFLKIVDKPPPKAEKPAEAKKPAAKAAPARPQAAAEGGKKLSPLEMARMQGAASKGGGVKEKTGEAKGGSGEAASDFGELGRAAAVAKPAAKSTGGKMSTSDILAAARGGASAPAKAPAEAAPAAESEPPVEPPTEEPAAEAAPEAPAKSTEKVDRSKMSTADIIAWCREHDSK